jgi:Anti-sigma factor NepR
MMEAMHSNPFNVSNTRSRRDKFDNKLRLALGRGLAAAYADVLREPIPERLQLWLRQLESRDRQGSGD